MKRILIAGASGLVGIKLQKKLANLGHEVYRLSFSNTFQDKTFHWNPVEGVMDETCVDNIDVIINLAGANVFAKRWSAAYKNELRQSRIKGTSLLIQAIENRKAKVECFINASAVGYYGYEKSIAPKTEMDQAGQDFLAQLCVDWEQALLQSSLPCRKVVLRFGVILDQKQGAFSLLLKQAQWNIAAPIGHGEQAMPWIHVDDIVGIVTYAIEHEKIHGIYNAVAPETLNNKAFITHLYQALHKRAWAPAVPAWLLNIALGEKASVVTQGVAISAQKIMKEGYSFKYPYLKAALKELIT